MPFGKGLNRMGSVLVFTATGKLCENQVKCDMRLGHYSTCLILLVGKILCR